MGNNASSPISVYTCQICSKILHKPMLIPCSVCTSSSNNINICQEHLDVLFTDNTQEALFECEKVKSKLSLKKTDFKENTQLDLELQRHVYLNHKKLKCKMIIDAKLGELEQYLTNIREVKVYEFRAKLNDYFYVLRNKVDIKRETVLEKYFDNKIKFDETNRSSENLIEQLDMTENEFRTNFMNKIESHINGVTNIDEYKRRLKELLRNNRSRKNDFVKLKIECESLLDRIQGETIQIEKRFTARLNSNKFDELFGDEDEMFVGELRLNNFQNEETRLYSRKVLEQAAHDHTTEPFSLFRILLFPVFRSPVPV
jgi:hypothetical protein